jgi:Domain of unknown function (DUF4398)
MRVSKYLMLLPALVLTSLAGCTHTAQFPPELANARLAYERVEDGPAAMVNAEHLREAKVALDAAEQACFEKPESPAARDLAYIAERRAEFVEAETGIILADRRKALAERLQKEESSP